MITLLILLGSLAWADPPQSAETTAQTRYSQVTEIDFEGVDIEATLQRPEGVLISDVKVLKFNPLLPLRMDFDKEMLESIDEVK